VRRLLTCLGATLAVGLVAPSAALACNGWSEEDMQTQLMCVTCRVPIDQSESRFAQHVRSFLHQKCVAGWTGSPGRILSVAARFPLYETAAAHREVERGGKIGTVVVEPAVGLVEDEQVGLVQQRAAER